MERFFHYKERQGTLGGEITAGILIGILSVCGMFMNMQLLAKMQITGAYQTTGISEAAANGEILAGFYFISMLIAFVSSLAIGLIARLPLVQVSSLGLGTVLISLVGSTGGLTYYNLLAICFLASIVNTVILSVPGLWQKLLNAIPNPVVKAFPAAVGMLIMWTAVQLTGVFSVGASQISTYGIGTVLPGYADAVSLSEPVQINDFSYATDKFHPLMLLSVLAVVIAVIVFLLLRSGTKHPFWLSLLAGTVFFLLTNTCFVCVNWKNFGMSLDSLWGRLWTVGSEDALQKHFYSIFAGISVGKIFTEGFDFSTYTANGGNVVLLFLTGIVTVALTNLIHGQAVLMTIAKETEADEKACRKALLCNAACGIAAPLVGGVAPSIGEESVAGVRDGGRSGLTSVAASVVYLISMFVWIVPFLFVTLFSYDIKFTMYGHYGETLQAMTECSFAVADIVMAMTGALMIKRTISGEWSHALETIPFLATVILAFFFSNPLYGVAAGSVVYLLVTLTEKEKIRTGQWIWGVCSVLILFLAML